MQYLLNIKYRRIIISLIAFMFLFKMVEANNQSRFQHLEKLDGERLKDAMIQYYDSVRKLPNYQERIKAADAAFEFTSSKGDLAHLQSLLFRASVYRHPDPSIFNEACYLAKRINDVDEICNVEYSRGKYYLARKQYDSAVYHILKYKDLTKTDITGDGYQNIVEFLGDIYYHAGLYKQAKELYSQIFQVYEDEDMWNYYRPYVMMNNLGQIALKTGNPKEAKEWFLKSLKLAESELHQFYRENTMAYIRIKLAETAIFQNNFPEAEKQLKIVEELYSTEIHNDVQEEYVFHLATLYLKQNKAEKAAKLAMQLIPDETLPQRGLRFMPEIYRLLAEIANAQNNDTLSLHYYQLFHSIEDSLKRSEHLSRSMIIMTEREIELSKMALIQSNKRLQILGISFYIADNNHCNIDTLP